MGIFDLFKRKPSRKEPADGEKLHDQNGKQQTSGVEMDSERDVRRTQTAILSFTLVGIFALLLFTFASISPFSLKACARLTGVGLLYAGAFFAVGALAGFLFGIPRSLQAKSKNKDNGESADAEQAKYATNTNLEEISDWLTKIIVGLGLVNLKNVPDLLKKTAWYFANFCGNDVCEAVAMGVMIYFFVCGFFLAYLMARLYLTGAFTRAEGREKGKVESFKTVKIDYETVLPAGQLLPIASFPIQPKGNEPQERR